MSHGTNLDLYSAVGWGGMGGEGSANVYSFVWVRAKCWGPCDNVSESNASGIGKYQGVGG